MGSGSAVSGYPAHAMSEEDVSRSEPMMATMRAVVLDAPVPPEALQVRDFAMSEPAHGFLR